MTSTVNNIYFKALSIYDEISKNGTINASKTTDYLVRTPSLVDMLQKELWETSDYTKIHEINYVSTGTWTKITLPSNFKSIKKVIIDYNNEYYPYGDYKLEKDGLINYIYIKLPYDCTVRIQYKPYPTTVTTINDTLELDNITLSGIAYGLTKWYAISEQNELVAKYCDVKFQEIKNSRVRQPATFEPITNVYEVF